MAADSDAEKSPTRAIVAEADSTPFKSPVPAGRIFALSADRGWLLPAALVALLVVLIVFPLITVLTSSFRPEGLPSSTGWTLSHYIEIWSSAYIYGLLANTLIFAFGSTLLATVIALALAWLIGRTDIPGRNFFRTAILMPMVTPPLLFAIGWVLIMSPRIGLIPALLQPLFGSFEDGFNIYSLGGMVVVQGLAYVPTAFLILTPMILNMDPTFEEAATVAGGSTLQTFFRVSLPFLIPSMLSIATLLVVIGMATFDVPAIIGTPANVSVLSSEIFSLMTPASGAPFYGQSAAINASLFIPLLLGLALYQRATRQAERFAAISGKGYKATRFALGKWKIPTIFFVSLYFVLAVALPFVALLWVSLAPYFSGFNASLISGFSLDAYVDIFHSARVIASIENSLAVAFTASIGLIVLALVLGWTIVRSRRRWVKILDILSMIPISVSHLMTGVALVFVFLNLRGIIPIYGTVWIIALAHIIIYLPLATRMMQAGLMQINRELEEAASVFGASIWQNFRRVTIPLLKSTIVALFIWIFVHSLREFSAAVMLQTNRNEVLSTILFSYWDTGEPARAAAIAIVLMLILAILVLIMGRFTQQAEERDPRIAYSVGKLYRNPQVMLVAKNLRKSFALPQGEKFNALDGISFDIPKGSFFTLLGPSGCGKTTLLRSIVGLERPDSGSIEVKGKPVFDSAQAVFVPPNQRKMGMVFQSYAIWPHMNVFENVAFPLRVGKSRFGAAELGRKIAHALETVQLGGYEKRPATRLSGGQQQRLALARALVMEPDLLLLDEPLSNLDAQLRGAMRIELRRLQRELGITTVYVTHDQSEALALSDVVAVMRGGRIVQLGDPEAIYNRPATRFVASFIGSTNVIEGTVRVSPGTDMRGVVDTAVGPLACLFTEAARGAAKVALSIRPENIELSALRETGVPEDGGRDHVPGGRVIERTFLGDFIDYTVAVAGCELKVRSHPERSFGLHESVRLRVEPEHCLVLPDDLPSLSHG